MWKVEYYRASNGDCPVEEYLENLPVKTQVKINNLLELLEEMGHELKRPYRILHFFFMKSYIICTHGFTKKANKVPPEEIGRALRIKKDFEIRYARGEYKL